MMTIGLFLSYLIVFFALCFVTYFVVKENITPLIVVLVLVWSLIFLYILTWLGIPQWVDDIFKTYIYPILDTRIW